MNSNCPHCPRCDELAPDTRENYTDLLRYALSFWPELAPNPEVKKIDLEI